MAEDFSIPLSEMNIFSRQKISKDKVERHITSQLDIEDIYRLLPPTTAQHPFFSSSCAIFTKTDHFLGHKTHISKFRKIELIQRLLSDHNGIKLESITERAVKSPNTWRLNNTLLNSTWVKGEISREM